MADEARDERSQGRATQEAQRRRRRGDETLAADKRLPIPPEVQERLDREGLVPRWVNDTRNRIARLTQQDDYDKVEGVEPVPVGTDETGKPIMAHLLAKPRAFVEEDRENADRRLRATEKSLFRDPNAPKQAGANPNNPTQAGEAPTYMTGDTKLERRGGNQVLDG